MRTQCHRGARRHCARRPTSTRSRPPASPTTATGRRWRSPTGRSARCRRRPARPPGSASAPRAARCGPALEARAIELEAERDARVLVDEAVDVTLPSDRRVDGARHPLTTIQELIARHLRRHGLRGRRRSGDRGRVVQLRRAEHRRPTTRPDSMMDTFFVGSEDSGLVLRTHTSPVQVRTMLDPNAADLRRLPRQGVPHRRARRHPHPGVPPDRGPGRRRGHHHGPPEGHARPHGAGDVRRRAS